MIHPAFELLKVAALAAVAALVLVVFVAPLFAAIGGVAALWLLLARIT